MEINLNEIKNVADLKESVVYMMSLGSKELYHSNIWAWLIEHDVVFVKAFFPDIQEDYTFDSVKREEGHRDLTIWYRTPDGSKKCYVIENKLKSIPKKEQLEKYTSDLGDQLAEGVLTGLEKPLIVGDNNTVELENRKWRFLSYPEITENIKAKLPYSTITENNKRVIEEYLKNNECMANIVQEVLKSYNGKLGHVWTKEQDETGLCDLINKLIGSRFLEYLNKRLMEEKVLDNLKSSFNPVEYLDLDESFHNKKTTIDAFSFFKLEIPNHVLTPVFGKNKGKGQKTCKKTRDGIVHAMNSSDLQEMHDRYEQLMAMMTTFLDYFQ